MGYETRATLVIGLFTLVSTLLALWLIARGGIRRPDRRDDDHPER